MPGIFFISPQPVIIDPNQQTVHSNATITASGSATYSGFGSKEVNYIINIKNSPTGTTPTITFTIQEVDPVDQTTVIGPLATSGALNAIGTSTLVLTNCITGTVKITWTVTGVTPSFTGINTTLLQKNTGGTVNAGTGNFNVIGTGTAGTAATGVVTVQGIAGGVAIPISGSISATNPSVSTTGTAVPGSATFISGSVTTAAPGYTTGNLGALSLTTTGLLRIDGSGVTQPISGTVTANAGTGNFIVTQATAANLNATVIGSGNFIVVQATASNLRTQTSSESATGATPPANAIYVGGSVTTAAPSYTIGQINPLSLNLAGGLRVDGSGVTQPVSGTVTTNQGGAPWSQNITQFGGTNISIGVGASGTGIPRVTVANDSNILATQSGTWITTSNQGTANTLVNAWPIKITDATNGPVAIKAASTTAVAADPSLVVALSPNTAGPMYLTTPNELANSPSIFATNFPAGFLRVSDEPHQLMYDSFDGAALDANNWNTPVSSGGGVASAVSGGNLTLGTGTTTAGYSYLQSTNSFRLTVPAWMGISYTISIENPITANTYRFWGQGTVNGVLAASSKTTPANSVNNGVGWEIGTDGKLLAVVWASGTRTIIQDLSSTGNSKQPTDALFHRYVCYIRTDKIYWYIDSLDIPVATSNFQSPTIQTLPDMFLCIAGTSPGSSGVITCAGATNWDTGKNNITISDGTYNWRKATVKAASTASIAGDTALVTAFHPSSPLPTGANTIGAITGTGSAGAAATGVVTIQGIAGGVAIPVSGTVTAANASVSTTATAVPGSATMIGGSVTTAAPSYTTGNLGALSLTTGGLLRVDGSGVSQTINGSVTANQGGAPWSENITQFGGSNVVTGTGVSGAGIPRVTIANDSNILATQAGTWTVQPGNTANTTPWLMQVADVTAAGSLGSLNANVQITLSGQRGIGFQLLAGTLIGTIIAELSFDGGVTWNATTIDTGNKISSIVFASSNTATQASIIGGAGAGLARIRVSAYTSGTANITLRATQLHDPAVEFTGIPGSTTQPPVATQIAGWDGTTLRVPVVKAASTAAVTGDQALVVAVSPNNIIKASLNSNDTIIQNAATLTASGSIVVTGLMATDLNLIINIKATPTGVGAALTYSIQDVDPIDQTTTFGASVTGTTFTGGGGIQQIPFNTNSSAVIISWTITGTTPSFTLVNTTLTTKLSSLSENNPQLQLSSGNNTIAYAGTFTKIDREFFTVKNGLTFTSGTIASGSASDTAAGTGARTVQIVWIGIDGKRHSQVATLNGTSTVALTFSPAYLTGEAINVLTVGSTLGQAGQLVLSVPGGTIVFTSSATYGKAMTGLIHIQGGGRRYIYSLRFSSSVTPGIGFLYQEDYDIQGNILNSSVLSDPIRFGTTVPTVVDFKNPIVAVCSKGAGLGFSRIFMYCVLDTATSTTVYGAFTSIEV